MSTRAELLAKIVELGGTHEEGINWEFAEFQTQQAATAFHDWLDSSWETRGMYNTGYAGWSVRFRPA